MLAKTYAKVITTPIFYVNSYPHIGHLQSAVLADTLSRYQVLKGNCCELSTGTDEHGLKIQEAAAKANSSEIHFCNRNSAAFQSLFNKSDIKYSKFIRTTDGNHIKTVKYFWSLLKESGMIYKGLHQGWYNVSDETFVPESMVVIENGIEKCKESGKVLRWTAEENYKFKLSDFQPRIIAWLLENPDVVVPKHQYDSILRQLSAPIADISISRLKTRVSWGIEVPGDMEHIIYVWLDALVNYLTAVDYPFADMNPQIHIIGKDIIKFHAIYWPAFLMAAKLPLPAKVITHGHWVVDGKKMSKSDGNGVSPDQLINKFGVDAVRYFLIRDGRIGHDSEYSIDLVMKRYIELGSQIGNLLSRCVSKSFIPSGCIMLPCKKVMENETEYFKFYRELDTLQSLIDATLNSGSLSVALEFVMDYIYKLNQYWGSTSPWKLSAIEKEKFATLTIESLRICAILLGPVMPKKTNQLLDAIGIDIGSRLWIDGRVGTSGGSVVMVRKTILFPTEIGK